MIGPLLERLRRRWVVRVKRQHLVVLWALHACVDPVTSLDLARLVDLTPSTVLVHLERLVDDGHARHKRTESGLRQFYLTPAGIAFIADLVEELLATANSCRHCGDTTELGDDPAPGLCTMCVKAGRT